MIETLLSPRFAALVIHRVAGDIDQAQATQGAAEALRVVQDLAHIHGSLTLVLDLRGKHFVDLQAHKAWSQGFARNPALQGIVRAVAIVDNDTPAFRAEQEFLTTEHVRFFVEQEGAMQWLAAVNALGC